MGWIFLTVLAVILFWVGIGVWIYAKHRDEVLVAAGRDPASESLMPSSIGLWAALGVVGLWIVVSAFFMVHIAGQREVAIVYNFSGTISGKEDAGTFMTAPWQHVKKENIGILHDEWTFDLADNAAVSKDQQKLGALLAVNYQIDAEKVVDLYKRVGPAWKTIIIDSRVPQIFKEVTSTYATPEITERREELRAETRKRLAAELKPYDIQVVDVFIKNLGFSPEYTAAIEAKQKQVQEAAQARARIGQIRAEAKQKIIAATADAKSNRLRRNSLNKLLIQQYAIDKLNPTVTTIICPPQSVCIPNAGVIPSPAGPASP
jgi:regulator of protease activity HflC (stomatin/prohibitin superfamily)